MGPITSDVERVCPFQLLLRAEATGLARDSKAQSEHIQSVAVERLGARIGVLPGPGLAALEQALRMHLALRDASNPALSDLRCTVVMQRWPALRPHRCHGGLDSAHARRC